MTPFYADRWLSIYGGDCREVLAELEPDSIDCVVTSPPYWSLRDYGIPSTLWGADPDCEHRWLDRTRSAGGAYLSKTRWQHKANGRGEPQPLASAGPKGRAPYMLDGHPEIPAGAECELCGGWYGALGLEPTPALFVEHMVEVFEAVRRVLRPSGSLWLNLGDGYAASRSGPEGENSTLGGTRRSQEESRRGKTAAGRPNRRWRFEPWGLKPKDLVGMPWRVALALQEAGWYLRSDVVWSKPNPMPESVEDRPTKSHEYVFLLTKRGRYFYDRDALREPHAAKTLTHRGGGRAAGKKGRQDELGKVASGNLGEWEKARVVDPAGRNMRSVWSIATRPYPGAHFAVFPPELPERCIKAGTSERGVCPECGAPWRRVVSSSTRFEGNSGRAGRSAESLNGAGKWRLGGEAGNRNLKRGPVLDVATIRWEATCQHDAEPVPAVVLDPFGGSGTVGMVAQALGRRAVLVDLNPDYLRQQLTRASREWGVGGRDLRDRPAEPPPDSLWAAAAVEEVS